MYFYKFFLSGISMFGSMVPVSFLIPPLTKVSEVESCEQQVPGPVASAVLEW